MRRFTLLFILVALSIFSACKTDPPASSTRPDELLPLAARNYWAFIRKSIDSNGVVVDSSRVLMSVGQPDTIGIEIAYPVSNFPFVFVNPGPLLWANKPGGLYNVIPGPNPIPAPVKVFQFPTIIGDSVRFSGHTIRTTLLNELIVVAAGSFRCTGYEIFQNDTLRGRLFIAPNIGIVKSC